MKAILRMGNKILTKGNLPEIAFHLKDLVLLLDVEGMEHKFQMTFERGLDNNFYYETKFDEQIYDGLKQNGWSDVENLMG